MNRVLLWIVFAVLLATACLLYVSHSSSLNVAPGAKREIEKAKGGSDLILFHFCHTQ